MDFQIELYEEVVRLFVGTVDGGNELEQLFDAGK